MKFYSRIYLPPPREGWVVSWEFKALAQILKTLGLGVRADRLAFKQIRYLSSKYSAASKVTSLYHFLGNKLTFDYYHGDPRISPDFSDLLEAIKKKSYQFHRIRVSHSGIENLLENNNFENRTFRIPIGINLAWFPLRTDESKKLIRHKLNIPESAVVIGSFQKDGSGWGDGFEPKLIKGPDVFLKTMRILKSRIPEMMVLLTGPSRGYMRKGLESLDVPYRHYWLSDYREIGDYYHALDTYIVSSREEGGPKAVLESMASGVPLISTRVGQAQDLLQHSVNGWLADVEDAEALASYTLEALENNPAMVEAARKTAEQNSYENQLTLWRDFFEPLLHS